VLWLNRMDTAFAPSISFTRVPDAVCHADRRVAIQSILFFWAFYFVLNTAHMAIEGTPNQLEMVCRRAAVVAIGIVLTFIMYAVLRRLECGGRVANVALPTRFATENMHVSGAWA